MRVEFFLYMIPPTTTHQMKKVNWKTRTFYEPENVADLRAKLHAHLIPFVPAEKLTGPIRLMVKWCFPLSGKHQDGEYRTSRPDTDNLQKMLKDVMTTLGFWQDDAQVASEIVEKFWASTPGIYIVCEEVGR